MIVAIISLGGLCNRMRTMASTVALSRELNSRCLFIWQRLPDMNAKFSDLFENFPYPVIDCTHRRSVMRLLYYLKRHWPNLIIDDDYAISTSKKNYLDLKQIRGNRILVNTCENFLKVDDFSMFKISKCISDKTMLLDRNTIGIHLRRTDSAPSKRYSPTYLFVDRMKKLVKEDDNTKFYLATDDPNEESYLLDLFPNNVIVFKKQSLDRNNPIAIEEALIDLYNLSQCKMILGSYWSSFSDTAAAWGRIKKEVLKIKPDTISN